MINISIETHKNLYYEYKDALDFCKTIDVNKFNYPSYKTNFHIYSEIKNQKEAMSVKSFFATQDIKHTQLILWSDYNVENNIFLQPFKQYIDFRIYDPIKESKNTILENCTDKLCANDRLYYSKSDLMRLLVCHKYGGIWIDMDVILLRNFKPFFDQEFVYMWGTERNFEDYGACATIIHILKNSEFGSELLKELKQSEIIPLSYNWGKDLIAKVYKRYKKFTIFPSVFFNTEWQMNPAGNGAKHETGWFVNNEYSNHLCLEAFSWHWHNTSYKNAEIQSGSKFDLLTKLIDNKLKIMGFI